MKRRSINIAAEISLLGAMGLACLSLRSYWHYDRLSIIDYHEYSLRSWDGSIQLDWEEVYHFSLYGSDNQRPGPYITTNGPVISAVPISDHLHIEKYQNGPMRFPILFPTHRLGFGFVNESRGRLGTYYEGIVARGIVFPDWVLIIPTVVFPLAILRRGHRERRSDRLGLCRECGYDLRATPNRCPECGMIAVGEKLIR
jgi:hypothetical protein